MTYEEALEWVADLFEVDVDDIQPTDTRDDIAGWDSLGALTLIAHLDDDFSIQMSEEEVQGLVSVDDILNILRRYDKLK